MSTLQILDVSLRDGGFRTRFHFSDEELQQILSLLDQTGIEYIEVGYRNGLSGSTQPLGRAAYCDLAFLNLCKNYMSATKISVMVHPQNIQVRDIAELKKAGVSLLRFCIAKAEQLRDARAIVDCAKYYQLTIALNIMNLAHYSIQQLDNMLEQLMGLAPDIIYFADSNGSMLPENIQVIYQKYISSYPCAFGFHAHDNLGLAQSNAIAAIAAGVSFIDVSLAGMGKGIGNLKAEFFLAYLQAKKIRSFHMESLVEAANFVKQHFQIGSEKLLISDLPY